MLRPSNNWLSGVRRAASALSIAAAACIGLVGLPRAAQGATVFFNGYGEDTFAAFGPNATVLISGDLGGGCLDLFGQASAKVYVVPHGSIDPTVSTTMGQVNAVITSSAELGLFEDETIGFTEPGGHIGTGNYDIVLDICADGSYDPDEGDIIAGSDSPDGAFTVTIPTDVPVLPSAAILALKAASKHEADTWTLEATRTKNMFEAYEQLRKLLKFPDTLNLPQAKLISKALDYLCRVPPGAEPICPTASWKTLTAGVLAEELGQAAHYQAIADDPPDPNASALVTISATPTVFPSTSEALEGAFANLGSELSVESGIVAALLHSVQKYQGAAQAGDAASALLQARSIVEYASQLTATTPLTEGQLESMASAVDASGLDFAGDSDESIAFRDQLVSSGFTAEQNSSLLAIGLLPSDIAHLRSVLSQSALDVPSGDIALDSYPVLGSPSTGAAELASLEETIAGSATELATAMGPVIAALEDEITAPNLPTATPGGPYTGTVGTPVSFDASLSTTPSGTGALAYGWDLTGSGKFTDASGPKPTFVFSAPRTGLVGVRVTNAAGGVAVSYAPLTVTSTVAPPVIDSVDPGGLLVGIPRGAAQTFTSTAVDAAGSPLVYAWRYDGTTVGTAPNYTLAPTLAGLHTLELTVTGQGGSAVERIGIAVLPPPRSLLGLSLLPAAPLLPAGTSTPLSVTGTYSDGSAADLTRAATWTTSDPAVTAVNDSGLLSGLTAGGATITATVATTTGSLTVSAAVTVQAVLGAPQGLSILPQNPTLIVGAQGQFHALATYADGSTKDVTGAVSWAASSTSVANLSSSGFVTATATGSMTITASGLGFNAQTTLSVAPATPTLNSVVLSPADPLLAVGLVQQFHALAVYSDGSSSDVTSSAVWSSSPSSVASISSTGLLAAAAQGTATVQAQFSGLSGGTSVVVGGGSDVGPATTFYVTERNNKGVAKITVDASGHATVQAGFVSGLPGNGPDSLIFDHQGNMLVSNTDVGTISKVNATTGQVIVPNINSTNLGLVADLALDPLSDTVWSIVYDASTALSIATTDPATGIVTPKNPDLIARVGGIAFNGSGSRLFVSSHNGLIDEIQPSTGHVLRSINVGGNPDGMTYDPSSGHVFVSTCGGGLCEIDIGTDAAPTLANVMVYHVSSDGIAADGQGNIFLVQGPCCLLELAHGAGGAINLTTVASNIPSADDVAPVIGAGAPPPPPSNSGTSLVYTGPAVGDYHDTVTPSAVLTDVATGAPIAGGKLTFTIVGASCSVTTGPDGSGQCSFDLTSAPGATTVSVTFAGLDSESPASTSAPFVIGQEQAVLAYTGATGFVRGSAATLAATLAEDGVAPIAGRTVTLTLGSDANAPACTGTTDASGSAYCTLTSVTVPLGPATILAGFGGDAFYVPATATSNVFVRTPTRLVYVGDDFGEHGDTSTLAAELSDLSTTPPTGIPGASVSLQMGAESCTAITDDHGEAMCSVTPLESATNQGDAFATYAGDATHDASSTNTTFAVGLEETRIDYTGPEVFALGASAQLTARLTTDVTVPLGARSVTFKLGAGSTAQSCTAITTATGLASCSVGTVTQSVGPLAISVAFAGDSAYAAASSNAQGFAYSTPAAGMFVIGNRSALEGSTVTFWDAQWSRDNSLTGGAAPCQFKGFADNVSQDSWSTNPGNSSHPPSSLPAYMPVLVASKITSKRSTINGDITELAIVRVNPGYSANPGHAGTGVVVAVRSSP
jgi:hypothetical protein